MARASDGRIGVSVNAETVKVLDNVKVHLQNKLGINASYTQAIQYLAMQYAINMINKDTITSSYDVPTQGE